MTNPRNDAEFPPPTELTPLSDPTNVRFVIVDDVEEPGLSPAEIQGLLDAPNEPGEPLVGSE